MSGGLTKLLSRGRGFTFLQSRGRGFILWATVISKVDMTTKQVETVNKTAATVQ